MNYIEKYIEEKRKQAIRNTVILLVCLVLFCCMLQYSLNGAKNEAANRKENTRYVPIDLQDTIIVFTNENTSISVDTQAINKRRTNRFKSKIDPNKDGWENEFEIK